MDRSKVGSTLGPFSLEYGCKDVVLYHLGIGFGAEDLERVYEGAPGGLRVFPTFAVVTVLEPFLAVLARLQVDLATILHAEQTVTFHRPIPPQGRFATAISVPAVYDRGKAALLVAETRTEGEDGALLFATRAGIHCRGAGGWGGDPGPPPRPDSFPDRPPDFAVTDATTPEQAVLYRLSGDRNPLHVDPAAARRAGFPGPLLHGLCTFGFAARAAVAGACGGDPSRLREFGARFTGPVFPGQALTTRGWALGAGEVGLRVATEAGEVLAGAYARIA